MFSDQGAAGTAAAQFTVCAVPMTLDAGAVDQVTIERSDGTREHRDELELTTQESLDIFTRSDVIARVEWSIGADRLARWAEMASAPE